MKLSQVYEQLTHGELRNLNIGGIAAGQIDESNYRAVANHIVLGLTALYKRFQLKEGRLTLQLVQDVFTYNLLSKYAVNGDNSVEPVRYIIDTVGDPFLDDILKIKSVISKTSNIEYELPLNNHAHEWSVTTPSMYSLRVPIAIVNQTDEIPDYLRATQLTVLYQANHPIFMPRVGFFDPELTEIELPISHLQALLYFVASRVNNPIGMTNEFNAGNNYAAKYEQECARLEADGLEVDQGTQYNRAKSKGFV